MKYPSFVMLGADWKPSLLLRRGGTDTPLATLAPFLERLDIEPSFD